MSELLLISAYMPWMRHQIERLLGCALLASATAADGRDEGHGTPWIEPSNSTN